MKLKKNFHSRLFGFAGFSGAGKTTLIEKIISEMDSFRVGYIKHDAHHFSMDHEGKDTYRQYKAGAKVVFINDSKHFALQVEGESFTLEKEYFKDCDFVLVEGHKYADHPKFLFLDNEGVALREFQEGKITNVTATIYCGDTPKAIGTIPTFSRSDISGVVSFINNKMQESIQSVELFGLVLAGGKSSRMGYDKSLINYHGTPQAKHLMQIFEGLNIKSFISCREDQISINGFEGLPTISDRFLNFGPLGGILSAMAQHPGKALLVTACDLPLVSAPRILELISERDPMKQATAFFNQQRNHFEPLFAIYEPSIYSRMLHFLGEGLECPQKVLFNSSIKKLFLKNQSFLENANTPEDQERMSSILEGL